jgi:putative ATP-binding cassette transporter
MEHQTFTRAHVARVWRLIYSYWTSEQRLSAWLLLVVVLSGNFALVYLTVRLNTWYREFYDALQNYDAAAFWAALATFGILATTYIAIAGARYVLRMWLRIRWRAWLTARYQGAWLRDKAFYRLKLLGVPVDNPDQRINSRRFVRTRTSQHGSVAVASRKTPLVTRSLTSPACGREVWG